MTQVLQGVLPTGWSQAANAISPWLSIAFLVGSVMPDRTSAVVAGAATLVLALVGYYATTTVRYGIGGGTSSVVFWSLGAVVGGPVFGLARAQLANRRASLPGDRVGPARCGVPGPRPATT